MPAGGERGMMRVDEVLTPTGDGGRDDTEAGASSCHDVAGWTI